MRVRLLGLMAVSALALAGCSAQNHASIGTNAYESVKPTAVNVSANHNAPDKDNLDDPLWTEYYLSASDVAKHLTFHARFPAIPEGCSVTYHVGDLHGTLLLIDATDYTNHTNSFAVVEWGTKPSEWPPIPMEERYMKTVTHNGVQVGISTFSTSDDTRACFTDGERYYQVRGSASTVWNVIDSILADKSS
jgi:hypothetical protein